MGSKVAIKVFKRKDLEQSIHHTSEPQAAEASEVFDTPEKAERRTRRELVNTVSNWVTERRERNRLEEIEAIRRIFGESTPTLSGA
jgi:uncharacterized protein YjiS (DUF1127 family)